MLKASLADVLKSMLSPSPQREYYAFTLLARDGRIVWSCASTIWVGWAGGKPDREVRAANPVIAENMLGLWRGLGQSALVVNDTTQLALFMCLGGNVLLEKSLAGKYFPALLEPRETAFDGAIGYKDVFLVPPTAFNKAPSRKHRMDIIRRDDFRCRICGRRPTDNSDVELHVHHIKPWGHGGLTEDGNLMTLCATCHTGLGPHDHHRLYRLLEQNCAPRNERMLAEYKRGVDEYRRLVSGLRNSGPHGANRRKQTNAELSSGGL